MGSSKLHKGIRQAITDKLKAGEYVNPAELMTRFEMEINESAAKALWARTYVARLVHSEARNQGLIALSCGPRGYKLVETEDELETARARAMSQLKGQATRGKNLLQKIKTLNQRTFDFEAVMVDGDRDAESKPAASASA